MPFTLPFRARPIRLVALFLVLAGFAATPAAAKAVNTTVDVDRPVVLAGETRPVYVLVRFTVPEAVPSASAERPPLNIALVLDRSGSMEAAGKIAYLKKAAAAVVGRMSQRDRLAVVEYDDRITVAWPSAPVEAPGLVIKVIEGLFPRGTTNLAGGMLAGIAEVRNSLADGAVNRVLLLSDGLANEGITHPTEIRKLAGQSKETGVPVTTLGLGLDYNEDLMQDIAQHSGGNYHYVENPAQMAGIFQRELSTLFQMAARGVDLRFEVDAAVSGIRVFGYPVRTEGRATVIQFPDFHAGEARSVVLRLDVAAHGAGPRRLGTLRFTYEDVATGERQVVSEPIVVRVSDDIQEARAATNSEAVVEAALVEAETRHEESLRLLDSGNYAEAETMLRDLTSDLTAQNDGLADVRIAKKIEALNIEVEQASAVASAPQAAHNKAFMKNSKQRLYQAMQGKRGLYMLQSGDSGHEVENLQRALAAAGAYSGPVDGKFSPELEGALRAYQSRESLDMDGIAGPATLRALGLY